LTNVGISITIHLPPLPTGGAMPRPASLTSADFARWATRCVQDLEPGEARALSTSDREIMYGFMWAFERIMTAYFATQDQACDFIRFCNTDVLADPEAGFAHTTMMNSDPWVFYDYVVAEAANYFVKR
jgi:hypothetical protein